MNKSMYKWSGSIIVKHEYEYLFTIFLHCLSHEENSHPVQNVKTP